MREIDNRCIHCANTDSARAPEYALDSKRKAPIPHQFEAVISCPNGLFTWHGLWPHDVTDNWVLIGMYEFC